MSNQDYHMSHTEHLKHCRRALRTIKAERNAMRRLLIKLRDAGEWYPSALEIDQYKANAESGDNLLKQINELVGPKDA